jgi:hypothetical protein
VQDVAVLDGAYDVVAFVWGDWCEGEGGGEVAGGGGGAGGGGRGSELSEGREEGALPATNTVPSGEQQEPVGLLNSAVAAAPSL